MAHDSACRPRSPEPAEFWAKDPGVKAVHVPDGVRVLEEELHEVGQPVVGVCIVLICSHVGDKAGEPEL